MSGLRDGARKVARILREAGYEAYFAGGCVRDGLLGIEPKDYDVVTDATPDRVVKLFRRTVEVGAAFGVVRVLLGGHDYEVATYREDAEYLDGRHPSEVVYSTSKVQDVLRRDFTINALLEDPVTGEVIDEVGGRDDLAAGVIRAVGDPARRIAEDRLRMIRAVRFAARLGFTIEPGTKRAIVENAEHLRDVSVERIVMELHAMWATARGGLGVRLFAETKLLPQVFPFLPPAAAAELEARHGRLKDACAGLPELDRNAVAWGDVLDLAGIAAREAEDLLRGYKLSRELIREVQRLLAEKPLLVAPALAREADRVRLAIAPGFRTSRAFLETLTGPESPALVEWAAVASQLAVDPLPPLPLVTGQDLIALGLRPGPEFKQLLRDVEDEVLERRIKTRDEALEWIRGRTRLLS